jgi:hypothetical protein
MDPCVNEESILHGNSTFLSSHAVNLDVHSCGLIAEIDWYPLVSIGFLLLLPLVPAVILYKLFEQKTIVSGPFRGLRLDLSGAFAGYFLLLIICSGLLFGPGGYYAKRSTDLTKQLTDLTKQLQDISDLRTGWLVRGTIALKTGDGSNDQQMDGVGIAIEPVPKILDDGYFEINVLKDKAGGTKARFPNLRISKLGYFPAVVHLEPLGKTLGKEYPKTIDESGRTVSIDQVVELKPIPSPTPTPSS